MEPVRDMFGELVLPERGMGRPAHVWTPENSNKINLMFACGRDVKDAAAAIGVSVPTLRKHYFAEVERRRQAAIRVRALQLARLNAQAELGNVAAEKALAAMIQSERVAVTAEAVRRRGLERPAAPVLGKKEAARHAAAEAEGIFATRPPPEQASLLN